MSTDATPTETTTQLPINEITPVETVEETTNTPTEIEPIEELPVEPLPPVEEKPNTPPQTPTTPANTASKQKKDARLVLTCALPAIITPRVQTALTKRIESGITDNNSHFVLQVLDIVFNADYFVKDGVEYRFAVAEPTETPNKTPFPKAFFENNKLKKVKA